MEKLTYNKSDKETIITDILSYIEQTPDSNERDNYMSELNEVKNNWYMLVASGVFHDAIGKVVNRKFNGAELEVEVITEY